MKSIPTMVSEPLPLATFSPMNNSRKIKLCELTSELMTSYEEQLDMQDALDQSGNSSILNQSVNSCSSSSSQSSYMENPHKHPSLCRIDTMSSIPRDVARLADTCTNHVVRSILKPANQTEPTVTKIVSCNSKNSCNYSCRCSCNPRSLEFFLPKKDKKVLFHAHVFIHYYHPINGDHVSTECIRLKGGPDRSEIKRRWQRLNVTFRQENKSCTKKSIAKQDSVSTSMTSKDYYPGRVSRQDSELDNDSLNSDSDSDSSSERCSIFGRVSASILSSDSKESWDDSCNYERVDIIYEQNANQDGKLLKFNVKIDVKFKPNDVIVKVNKVGLKVKIQANCVDHEGRTVEMIHRYLLPKNIDSKLLNADLDKRGVLRIDAPVL